MEMQSSPRHRSVFLGQSSCKWFPNTQIKPEPLGPRSWTKAINSFGKTSISMFAAGPKSSWQQRAPGHVPGSTFPGQGDGAWGNISAELQGVRWVHCRQRGRGCSGLLGAARATSPLHSACLPLGLENKNQVCLSTSSRSFLTC